jgi:hypothetical protein
MKFHAIRIQNGTKFRVYFRKDVRKTSLFLTEGSLISRRRERRNVIFRMVRKFYSVHGNICGPTTMLPNWMMAWKCYSVQDDGPKYFFGPCETIKKAYHTIICGIFFIFYFKKNISRRRTILE